MLRLYGCFKDRPCRALSFFVLATQGLVALAGLRTLGFGWIAPIGAELLLRELRAGEGAS